MEIIWIGFCLFWLGACAGSFVNVLVTRSLFKQRSWLWGRSECEECHKTLRWWELVPIVSFVALRGKCARCRTPISLVHPVVELLMGLLFLWWYVIGTLFFQLTQAPFQVIQPLFWLLIGVLCLVLVVVDARYFLLPDWAIIALTGLTVAYRAGLLWMGIYQWHDIWSDLAAMVVVVAGMAALNIVTKGKGLGWGDVKLMIPLTLLAGWPRVVIALMLAVWSGAAVGVGGVLLKFWKWRQPIPFGPFLIIGTALSLWWGTSILRWIGL
jgi:leader peptidase (prepilin peptidase) / N-methyltransferase